ncbi:MAG: DNA translocase FtsK [Chloroflexota bacterium]|nr:DNA translocase FtsK [Chloroflexota bacterium]
MSRRRPTPRGVGGPSIWSRLGAQRRLLADVAAVGSIILGVICGLALAFPSGHLTGPLRWGMSSALGWTAFVIPAWLIGLGLLRLALGLRTEAPLPAARLVGALLATLALPALVHLLPVGEPDPVKRAFELQAGGGAFGLFLSEGLIEALGEAAAAVLLSGALGLGLLLLFDLTLAQLALALGALTLATGRLVLAGAHVAKTQIAAPRLRVNIAAAGASRSKPLADTLAKAGTLAKEVVKRPRSTARPAQAELVDPAGPPPPAAPGQVAWRLPAVALFKQAARVELSEADVRNQARVIEETLASFNIQARVAEVTSGPTITQFGIEPGPGVAVNRIMARSNDLALRLGATSIRLEAPVPGRRVIGVEVPNLAGQMVSLRELLESDAWEKIRSKLRLALGRDVSGNAVVADLAKMPHVLIAGATGSGKSVCINTIVASLIYQSTPDELQFVMIDPKMVELVGFNGIPHLRMPVVTDMDRVVGTLKWVVKEMERRYTLFASLQARNLEAFNKKMDATNQKRMPFLVVVIDELADMMMTAGDEVERLICRLAQLARATGIHLVVATQRPSVDVITGLIKANMPTRISFAVSSHIDSRTILDTAGAEKLLGRGDMLYLPQDSGKPVRLQGAYVSDDEMGALVEFWKRLGSPQYTEEDVREVEALGSKDDDDGDELYEKAVQVAEQYRRVSTSLLQRRLGIGYPRAARLMDLLEERGVVGPSDDGKSREVIDREALTID